MVFLKKKKKNWNFGIQIEHKKKKKKGSQWRVRVVFTTRKPAEIKPLRLGTLKFQWWFLAIQRA